MGKFSGVLLVSDFDDTLCGPGLDPGERNRAALRRFLEGGGRFTVATGRAHNTFERLARTLPLNAPVILGNGGALYDFAKNEYLSRAWLAGTAPEDLAEFGRAFPSAALEVYHGDDIYAFRPNSFTQLHLRRVGMACTVRPLEDIPRPWAKAIAEDEYEALLAQREWLLAHLGGRYEITFSNRLLLEVIPKGCTKGSMVTKLAFLLGIRPENVYCIGDNQNDLPMLAVSAIPFAPAGCAREVRESGARLLGPCEEGAVADAIEILDRRYPG